MSLLDMCYVICKGLTLYDIVKVCRSRKLSRPTLSQFLGGSVAAAVAWWGAGNLLLLWTLVSSCHKGSTGFTTSLCASSLVALKPFDHQYG